MRFEKKGQLTTYQIVLIILALLGLVIALIFFSIFKDTANTSDDLCHLSVISRGTSPQALQSYIPLKCTTKKICLTADSRSQCQDSFAGEQDVTVVTLPADTSSAARVIEQTTADAMYSCWSIMGQGKIDLFSNFQEYSGLWSDINNIKPYCTICSRVAIDSSVTDGSFYKGKDSKGNLISPLNQVNVYAYMKSNVPAGQSLTYLQLFADQQVNSYPVVDPNLFEQKIQADPSGATISSTGREIAFLFMQIKSSSPSEVLSRLAGAGAITAGGAFLTGPTRAAAGVLLFSGGTSAILTRIGIIGAVAGFAGLNAYSGQVMAAGYCGSFTGENGASQGCSLIEAVPYNAASINQLCGTIEGNP